MFEGPSPEKSQGEKDWCQQVEHMQVPNGTGPGVVQMSLYNFYIHIVDI